MSPLDPAIGPIGNVLVSSEYPFGALEAATSVREYDQVAGSLVRVFAPAPDVPFRRPCGVRFARTVVSSARWSFRAAGTPTGQGPSDLSVAPVHAIRSYRRSIQNGMLIHRD